MKLLGAYCPALLTAVIILLSASSCSNRSGQVTSALAAADSLMMAQPQAALDTLNGLDSTAVRKMGSRDKAFYTLLLTEAKYKCYLPVAKDTAILEAVKHYRRRGPEDRLARALTMQGAVLSERGDADGAMAAYKEAEPIIEKGGDLEQLGLINTRIGELYQRSFINDSAAIARYRKALDCFEQAGLPERTMYAHSSIARMLMLDSANKAMPHLEKAMSMAELSGNSSIKLSCIELYSHYYYSRQDFRGTISTTRRALPAYRTGTQNSAEKRMFNNIFYNTALTYSRMNLPDSARIAVGKMSMDSSIDSMMVYYACAEIARKEERWQDADRLSNKSRDINDRIVAASYDADIYSLERELDYQRIVSDRDKAVERQKVAILISLSTVLFLGMAVLILYSHNKKLKAEGELLLASIRSYEHDAMAKTSLTVKNEQTEPIMRDMLSLIGELNDSYFRYGSTSAFPEKIKSVIEKFFPKKDTPDRIYAICENLYPGILAEIRNKYPQLTGNDIFLIALLACGLPTGAICAIKRVTESSFNVHKSRVASKMKLNGPLSDFVSRTFEKHRQ